MTNIDQRFMETVPSRLKGIEDKLERISDTLDRFTDAIIKLIEKKYGETL